MEENIVNPTPTPPQRNPKPKQKSRWLDLSLAGLGRFLRHRFDLNEDRAEQSEVVENISKSVEFRGTNLWVLMFAIVVASVGLNVNSTAVIIGAMLISPLMGPIMGVGLSLGINDFELLKKSLRNLLFAVSVSLIVSALYFMASPLTLVQSELLARTTPTIWDVLIAIFGGLAGIVAQSRRDRTTTVIPGVAIATALMPPLCTAGFGLATGEWQYLAGAIYLFFINAVFIAFTTFFIVRFLKYRRKKQMDSARTKRVQRIMAVVFIVTIVPSVLMAYNIVKRTIFETSAQKYIESVFVFDASEVVNSTFTYNGGEEASIIEVVMMGEALSNEVIDIARRQLDNFSLKNTELKVRQANKADGFDNAAISSVLKSNAQIIEEKNAEIAKLRDRLSLFSQDTIPSVDIAREAGALWNQIENIEIARSKSISSDGAELGDAIICILHLHSGQSLAPAVKQSVERWLMERTKIDNVRIIIDNQSVEAEERESIPLVKLTPATSLVDSTFAY